MSPFRGMASLESSQILAAVGGEWGLRAIIHDFVDRMVDDDMIGFYFEETDIPRLRQKEYEMTARFLGIPVEYTGKPLRPTHQPFRITGGHFDRRRKILAEALERAQVPQTLREHWLRHVDQLRSAVIAQPSS